MGDDIEQTFNRGLERTREQTNNCAMAILSYLDDVELKKSYLKELESVLVSCAEDEHAVSLAKKAAKEAEVQAVNSTTCELNSDLFDEVYEKQLKGLQQKYSVQEAVDSAPSVKAFRNHLLSQTAPAAEESEDDDPTQELVRTEESVNMIDPISKQVMKDPVRNRVCGHVYDRTSVTAMIKAAPKRKGFRCPTIGCSNRTPLKMQDLEDALDIKRQIFLHLQSSKK